jgi:flagellar FliL protein
MDIKVPGILILLLSYLFVAPVFAEEEGEEGSGASSVQYHELTPAFVANFGDKDGKKLKFVKAGISVRVSSGAAINEVMNHDALVRHQIVMLLSRQSEESLSNSMGQEKVRLEALKIVKEALEEETGDGQIDDLLFTSFVVQR